jgi:hypothetical protein
MTNTYLINAWCLRPFITSIDVEAATPRQAIAVARREQDKLLDAAEECTRAYPWDEFAVYDESGNELLHELDEEPSLRRAAPVLREALARLATAAEDLDVAIDGVTDQFDSERAELQDACCNARTVLAKTVTTGPERRPA